MTRVSIRYLVSVFFMATILLTGSSALAAPPDNFTATMVSSGMEMPMARMGTKSRIENPGMQDVVTISLGELYKSQQPAGSHGLGQHGKYSRNDEENAEKGSGRPSLDGMKAVRSPL